MKQYICIYILCVLRNFDRKEGDWGLNPSENVRSVAAGSDLIL
jgi:hypothetical protein